MSYKYIGVPTSITLSECKQNDAIFAPSKYTRFLPSNTELFEPLSKICKERKQKVTVVKSKQYQYSEIGDIDISNGTVQYRTDFGLDLPSENPKLCKPNDLLISTVRTYRGGFGMLISDKDNHCCSPAITVIKEVDQRITKEYLLAVLRTDFFIEQILGFQTRGMYPRLDSNAMDKVVIPIPKDENIIKYVSALMRACLNKYELIKKKHEEILHLIDNELTNNQNQGVNAYRLPTIKDLLKVGRLDTGLYSENFWKQDACIKNYSNGYTPFLKLNNEKVDISRGQNLQESNIGKSIYDDNPHKGYYRLALSKNFTDAQTVVQYQYLGNPRKLKTISMGEIIFSCRGDMGRNLVFCEPIDDIITNIDSVHIAFKGQELYKTIFISQILGYLRTNEYLKTIAITGSGADSFTKYQFALLNIPNFPDSKQKEIAALYHNPQDYNTEDCTVDTFLDVDNKYNASAGIYELDKTAKRLLKILNDTIDKIVNEQSIDIVF
ncbi:MAG: hypothetical protein K6F10_04450 [Paludibacteraceae bacterium]|nr:hypothetical protein [Paludibacteraceae bacterium]